MGRKNISTQRREEILDAFEVCIEKYGFGNSSTRRISEEAGIKQPLISHYFGSKDAMVTALVDRIIHFYIEGVQDVLDNAEENQLIDTLLDYVFGPGLSGNKTKANLIGSLIAAAVDEEKLKQKMKAMYTAFLKFGKGELAKAFPDTTAGERAGCVYGILCLIAGNDVVLSVDIPWSNRKHARQCANTLIQHLQKKEI